MNRTLAYWLGLGWAGYLLLPWYVADGGFWSMTWLIEGGPLNPEHASAFTRGILFGNPWWLAPMGLALVAPMFALTRPKSDPLYANILIAAGAGGMVWLVAQGFTIGIDGWEFPPLRAIFDATELRQDGMGFGAAFMAMSFLFLFTQGLAARGLINGDVFVVGAIGFVIAVITVFIFFPVFRVLTSALQDRDGLYSISVFLSKIFDDRIWGFDCLYRIHDVDGVATGQFFSGVRCGVAWNSLLLGILTGVTSTLLGLAFALIAVRTRFRAKKLLRVLTVLPIITPPFVIGLAIILIFGRSGVFTAFMSDVFGVPQTRWIYGLTGVWFAQSLAFAPISFLVLVGVVEGVSPSMEEAAQTLRATPLQTFFTVSLPLMRPGLANAFLLGFIESLADFGNPMVLGGNYDVLSTDIFFAVIGARNDPGRAAVLAIVLLAFTLSAFAAQRLWLGKKSYVTVTGKGDSGVPVEIPGRIKALCFGTAIPWAAITVIIYVTILAGGFVELLGRDNTLTFRHYVDAFSITSGKFGLVFSGLAWDSFWTTIWIALTSAPLTAIIGLLTAYLIVRQNFAGKNAFEFGTMLSFAIPGTVIGISYILAFNVPPIELTGTAAILIISFIFRNMPVGVRAGIASMSQIDKSLDEASLTLGANSFTTMRKVILPLLRPAIIAALVFSFVRAMTALSAVIFLVSAKYDLATSFIIGRVENGDFGMSIAYSSVLILVMLVVILIFQLLVGERQLGRRKVGAKVGPQVEGLAG